jgi:hypothetical protein
LPAINKSKNLAFVDDVFFAGSVVRGSVPKNWEDQRQQAAMIDSIRNDVMMGEATGT